MAKRKTHLFGVHVTNSAGRGCLHLVRGLDQRDVELKVVGRWPGKSVDVDEACCCEDEGGCPDDLS